MKNGVAVILLMALLLISTETVRAQDPNAASTLDDLRGQLSDVDYKEADLKIRLEQLNSDLKPENIERYFNGYGSTRPEELREAPEQGVEVG